jgi:hypothetical protein
MDIQSYLPYEGKVVLHNKRSRTALVRLPAWLSSDQVNCFLNDKSTQPSRLDNQLVFENLKEKDEIRLEFPVHEETSQITIYRTKYTLTHRGSTIVDIRPRKSDLKMYPLYERDFMKTTKAPMRKVTRFVTETILPLQ